MIFIETSLFTKLIRDYLTDDEYLNLQKFLLQYPEAGKIIQQTGVLENYAGLFRARAKAVESGSSITGKVATMKSGY